jgi:sarcosine reductase
LVHEHGKSELRLELNIVRIKKVQFDDKTAVHNGVLSVDRQALTALLAQDSRLKEIEIELANPGEKCRILNTADIIEPRARTASSGPDFPGVWGAQATAGQGTTCVLRGAAVLINDYNISAGQYQRPGEGIIDMWGPGAEAGPYGKLCNVVVLAQPANGTSIDDFCVGLKTAGLKAAVYIASAGIDLTPDETEIYEIPSIRDTSAALLALPRITYIFQLFTNQRIPLPGDPILYGQPVDKMVPTVLHPNEVFDGALTDPFRGYSETYVVQNHPMVKELYQNHGKTLFFAGVIICNAPNSAPEHARTANVAANLAKWTLDADGAILTKIGGGAPELTLALTAQRCEELGIRTTLALMHQGIDASEITMKASTVFANVPQVDAMVSMGASTVGPMLTLAVADKVIGTLDKSQLDVAMQKSISEIKGCFSQLGDSKLMAVRY